MRLDFNEANIIKQNLFSATDNKKVLLDRLDGIYKATEPTHLKVAVALLIKKIEALSDADVKRLWYQINKGKFVITANAKVIQKN